MKFQLVDEIPFPRELVFTTFRDRLLEVVPYYGNIEKVEIPSRREEGNLVHFQNVWQGKSDDIPAVIRPILKPEYLRWVDRATWDAAAFKVDWNIDLLALPGVIVAKGTNRFRDEGGDTVFEVSGDFSIVPDKIPGVPAFAAKSAAPAIERFIVAQLQPNLRGGLRAVQRFLEDQG